LQYSNPEIPEGINTSKEHPLKEFLWLTGGVLAIVIVAVASLVFLTDTLTAYIPFSVEKNISLPADKHEIKNGPMHTYLQSLAERVARAEDLPDDMSIRVHYVDGDTVNAFATLGGNVILFRGLLEKLPNENSLAMLLAHEIAHIKYRHPIRGVGRGVVVGLALSAVSASAGNAVLDEFLGKTGYLTILQYSRSMESQADEEATRTVLAMYGTLNGADDLFKILQKESGDKQPPKFFSTHPLTASRIARVESYKEDHHAGGNAVTPLPAAFSKWVQLGKGNPKNSTEDCSHNKNEETKIAACD
jgi:beta-barrel assembly-enhancing protease